MRRKRGNIEDTTKADIKSQLGAVLKMEACTGIVFTSICPNTREQINSVQLKINDKINVTAIPLIQRGSINLCNKNRRLAPSKIALSSISFGISSIKLLINSTAKGKFINV